jgi:outer membrane protein OmpA-like peptidoglycan-associated protein
MLNRVLFSLLLAFCLTKNLSAQNLVMNPSFEETKPNAIVVPCEFMQYSQYFGEKLKFWTTTEGMTPDLLQAADNCPWLTQTHTGQQCIGIVLYLPASDVGEKEDYHERVRGRLKVPMKPGQRYRVECWVREDSSIIRQHLASVYTPKTPVVPVKSGNLGFYFYVKDPLENPKPQINFAQTIVTHGAWLKLSAEFVPEEPFEYFWMGNFFPDRLTANNLTADQVNSIEQKNGKIPYNIDKVKRASYLCIDDVSVEPMLPPPSMERSLLVERKFTFSAGVLFDSGKAELRAEAGPELDSLVAFLKKHSEIRMGISGHTDDVGSDTANLDLSERRAQAVQQYLLKQGIPVEQTRAKGFGETKPVTDNLTEVGRQANRRVECVVLKKE